VAFDLTDHTGRAVSAQDFAGRPMVLFFGYANCQSICSVALPRIGAALTLLGEASAQIAPVMITIDPANDTPAAMAAALPRHHPAMIGLTGSEAALAAVRARFQVSVTEVARDAAGAPIYAHGSFVYLIDGAGTVRTLVPPILGPERLANLIAAHLLQGDRPGSG
jgi:protein SCO1/2